MRLPVFHELPSPLDLRPVMKQALACVFLWIVSYAPMLVDRSSGADVASAAGESLWIYVQFATTFLTIAAAMSVAARTPAAATLLLASAAVALAFRGDWQTLLAAAVVCALISLLANWIRGLNSPSAASPTAEPASRAGHPTSGATFTPEMLTTSRWTSSGVRQTRDPASVTPGLSDVDPAEH